MKESLEDKDTRQGGENELRGSKDAQRALQRQRKMDRKDKRSSKR
jgi:hypothetical protein